jgi:S1-C subfamily serine protease
MKRLDTRWPLALLTILGGVAVLVGPPGAYAKDALDAMQERIIRVSKTVTPAVVHVEAVVRQNNRRNVVTGSGFIVSKDGIALTNHHVVERAEKVMIGIPDRNGRYVAEVLGTDKQTDLAVMRIHPRTEGETFPVTKLGDSDKLQVGEWVVAIGNPYGLDGTVSLGIISAEGRDLESENLLNDFIQTDAMIDRGSSGGPLVRLDGEVIGINSRGQGRGIGFTIPINTAKRVMADLLGDGQIARGYLGVVIQPLERELATYWDIPEVEGVVVNGVVEGSPAEQAGVKVGDIVTRFSGEPVSAEKDEDIGDFQRRVARSEIGEKVEVEVFRAGKKHSLSATLSSQPKVVPDEEETPWGFTVQELTLGLIRLHRLDASEGVLVSFVERGSEGAEAGLTMGDLIVRVNEQPVPDLATFREALEAVNSEQPFLIEALRGPDRRFMLIAPRGKPEGTVDSSEPRVPQKG